MTREPSYIVSMSRADADFFRSEPDDAKFTALNRILDDKALALSGRFNHFSLVAKDGHPLTRAEAEPVLEALAHTPPVTAAYVKPAAELA